MQDDLRWWWHILASPRLNGVPLRFFQSQPPVDIVIHMDACDQGLCAVYTDIKEYVLYEFTHPELEIITAFNGGERNSFDINYRELLSSAFAASAWATRWQHTSATPVHVHFEIDNTSAVAWHQRARQSDELGVYRDLAVHYRLHAIADSSLAQYRKHFALWREWTLAGAFILHGTHKGFNSGVPVRAATAANYLSGIAHFFRAQDISFPSGHPQIVLLLKGIGRTDPAPQQKHPVSLQLLACVRDRLDQHDPRSQALWGALCVAFFFLLRRSEIAAGDGQCYRWFCLRARDIHFMDKDGSPTRTPADTMSVSITLAGGKNHQFGPPLTRMLKRSGHAFLCPVEGALTVVRAHGLLSPDLPVSICEASDGSVSATTAAAIAAVLRAAASSLGLNPKRFSTHSLHSGGYMYKAGVDPLTIQFHGQWKSDAYKLYTRLCAESVETISSDIVRGVHGDTTLQ